MKVISTIIFALISYVSFAQKNHVIKLVPEATEIHTHTFYIDSIIDNRISKDNIGMAQVGLGNRQVEAVFEGDFESTLQQYFAAICKIGGEQKKLVAIIETLNVSEKTYSLKETGTAEVKVTFCQKTDGNLFVIGTFEFTETSGGMDVTAGQGKRLKKAIGSCIEQLLAQGVIASNEIYQPIGTWTASDDEHHILRCATRVRGIYDNLNELRSNSPAFTGNFSYTPTGDLFLLRSDDGKKAKEPYGFCDGKNLYLNTFFYNQTNGKARFAQVREEGRYLLWLDHYISAGEAAGMGAAFGAIGMMAAKSGLDCIILDLKTGIILPVNNKNAPRIFKQHSDLLKQFQESGGKIGLVINIVKELNRRESF